MNKSAVKINFQKAQANVKGLSLVLVNSQNT